MINKAKTAKPKKPKEEKKKNETTTETGNAQHWMGFYVGKCSLVYCIGVFEMSTLAAKMAVVGCNISFK